MDKRARPTNPIAISFGDPTEVVRFRFGKAFPELTKCLAWISGGAQKGIDWQPLASSYANRLSSRRYDHLVSEVSDVRRLGIKTDQDYDVLVNVVLGLGPEVLAGQDLTPRGFLGELESKLLQASPTAV